jgi:hypothetical protein
VTVDIKTVDIMTIDVYPPHCKLTPTFHHKIGACSRSKWNFYTLYYTKTLILGINFLAILCKLDHFINVNNICTSVAYKKEQLICGQKLNEFDS